MILQGNVYSKVLEKWTALSVCFSRGFDRQKPYKVAYILHGLHGDNATWLANTQLAVFADEVGRNCAFVMPDAGRSYYANLPDSYSYLDYISGELPEIAESYLGLSAPRERTALMGCSMGGFGSFLAAFTRPERFGFVGGISNACLYAKNMLLYIRGEMEKGRKTTLEEAAIIRDCYAVYGKALEPREDLELLLLAQKLKPGEFPRMRLYCGTEDSFVKENRRWTEDIRKMAPDVGYEEWAGGHDWVFFNEALRKALAAWDES
jgi:S-formylglutathione hydrolase FrmB